MKLHWGFVTLAVLLAIRFTATWLPSSWLWGIDSLADGPALLRLTGVILFALALIPPIGRALVRAIEVIGRIVPKAFLVLGGVGGCLIALYRLRSNNLLLGDSQTYLSSLTRGVRVAGGAHREPLAQTIVTAFFDRVGRPLGWSAQEAFLGIGLILAVFFLVAAIALAKRLADSTQGRLVVLAALLFGGGLQLYAGYAEFYGFALAGLLAMIWLGLAALEGKTKLFLAGLAFVLATLSHAQVLFTFPALVYLLIACWRRGRRMEVIQTLIAIPIATFGILLLLRYPFGDLLSEAGRAGSFLPPLGKPFGRTAYSILSVPHLIELVNVALLISPVLPVLLLGIHRAGEIPRQRFRFLVLLAIGPILFALCANPQLGMVRDWDIFVIPIVLLTLLSAVVTSWRIEQIKGGSSGFVGAVLITAFLHTAFWIGNNHQFDMSRNRLRRVAHNSSLFGSQTHGEIWRFIGGADARAGQIDLARESYIEAVRAHVNERMAYRLLAKAEIDRAGSAGRGVEDGLASYHATLETIEHRPAFAYLGGCLTCLTVGRDDLALAEAQRMVAEEPDYPELVATLGDLLRRAGRYGEAESLYEQALERDPDHPRARLGLASLAGVRGDLDELKRQVEETLRRTPWSPQAQQYRSFLSRPDMLTRASCRMHFYIQ